MNFLLGKGLKTGENENEDGAGESSSLLLTAAVRWRTRRGGLARPAGAAFVGPEEPCVAFVEGSSDAPFGWK